MSKRNGLGPGFLNMLDSARLMQAHEVMVDIIGGRPTQYELVLNTLTSNYEYGLDYPDQFYESEDFTDDDDDDEYDGQNTRYCGFAQNFLDKRGSNQLPAITYYKPSKRVTPEEAAKNAKELLAEEEKLKKKAEKKKQKKMRQRERRRLEKLEKENENKNGAKQDAAAVSVKSEPTEKECANKKKTNNNVPPDPGPQHNSIDSNDSCDDDDDDDDDQGSIVDELELDMSSCFVNNAAAIAKRKLEQKPKSERKDRKAENFKKPGTAQKSTTKPQNVNEEEESHEPEKDNVKTSMALAELGNKCAQEGNLDMSVEYFTDAIKHNPQEFKLFGNRSFCYEKMQQYDKALTDAEIALSLNPTWTKGLYRKGKALVGLKRYYEARLTYKQVLNLDSTCTDAAQELMRVQIMQLMDMGYSREQSSNALIIHGTIEKALETLSGLHGNMAAAQVYGVRVCSERNPQPAKVPLRPVPPNPPKVTTAVPATPRELFPVWVGDLVPAISELKIHDLFSKFGEVYSVRLLSAKRCAFVNYTKKEDCETAIQVLNGFRVAGTCLVVRYPDRIHTHLGVSKAATTDTGKVNKFPDECCFWRSTGCIKSNRCPYRHVPEHKGIDQPNFK